MAYAKHKLGRTFYLTQGMARDGIPLICLHGGPGSGCNSLKPLLELSDERQVVIYDQLGCGKSSPTPSKKWDMKVFVQELDLLAKSLGFKTFYIFGVSCGATLAIEYYLTHPDKVTGIIFQSPYFSQRDWQRDAIQLIKKMKGKNREILLKTIAGESVSEANFERAKRAYYLRHVIRLPKIYDARMKARRGTRGGKIYEYMWGKSEHHITGTLIDYERGASLKRVKVPTLIICGQHDEATPKTGRKYAKSIRGSKFIEVKGASHAISAEKPAALKKLVRLFLRTTKET